MRSKLFELRDKGTLVPALCWKVEPLNDQERWLLRRSGFGLPSEFVIMVGLETLPDRASYDPFAWGNNRTRLVAHKYITENWDKLVSGAVIDVEFILGETTKPKETERP